MIHLACTKGNLGYWDYYSTVMKVEDIVTNNRIITVSESSELYTDNINRILQREVKLNRISAISRYILNEDERFLGSIVVAIHQGAPKWTEVDINQDFEISGVTIDESSIDFLGSKFGVLSLNGDEQIFALDGQHRMLGLRKAYEVDPEIGNLEISIIFVVHRHEQFQKTRRLFTVLNKYAEKPKGAELIILDEDDAAAIITRKLVSEHPVLSKTNGISNSKTGAIASGDDSSFTTLVTIDAVNKILFSKPKSYYNNRPAENELVELHNKAKSFWDTIFECFPELVSFIDGDTTVQLNSCNINRADSTGGSLLLRPVGHKLLAEAFKLFSTSELPEFKEKIIRIDMNLSSDNWRYVFWNEKMLGKEAKLKKNLLLFMLGKFTDRSEIQSEMSRVYESFNQVYSDHISPVELD